MRSSSDKKFAVINGAYGGMGFAIVNKLAEAGYSLILLGRHQGKLEDCCLKIKNRCKDIHIVCYVVDVKDNASMEKAALAVKQSGYNIDALINAVGIVPIGNILNVTEENWNDAIQTSLMSAVRLVKNFARFMVDNKSGKIVFINGVLSRQPEPNLIISSTVTGAINNFAKALSREMGKHHIRVNTLNPGATATPLWDNVAHELATIYQVDKEQIIEQAKIAVPLGRIANVDDIANAVHFLCSDQSQFINGAFITIDGGASVAY
jgi:NAD(P)-dependent dehydrogenase (short-subunit alcohol dehydrogenase family)